MAYRGKFTPKNPNKYIGDVKNIVYRSNWERNIMRWIDKNPAILKWNSEEVVIPYICQTDKKWHRYFMDFYFETKDGKKFLIEVKPKKETMPPKNPGRRTKRYIQESLTFIKNQSKWKATEQFAFENNCVFQIWSEDDIKSLGIKL